MTQKNTVSAAKLLSTRLRSLCVWLKPGNEKINAWARQNNGVDGPFGLNLVMAWNERAARIIPSVQEIECNLKSISDPDLQKRTATSMAHLRRLLGDIATRKYELPKQDRAAFEKAENELSNTLLQLSDEFSAMQLIAGQTGTPKRGDGTNDELALKAKQEDHSLRPKEIAKKTGVRLGALQDPKRTPKYHEFLRRLATESAHIQTRRATRRTDG